MKYRRYPPRIFCGPIRTKLARRLLHPELRRTRPGCPPPHPTGPPYFLLCIIFMGCPRMLDRWENWCRKRCPRVRESGGIGRRAGFRCLCPQGCGGSSPPFRTVPNHPVLWFFPAPPLSLCRPAQRRHGCSLCARKADKRQTAPSPPHSPCHKSSGTACHSCHKFSKKVKYCLIS